MKSILFNCSTNNVGGGVKNSAIFIRYALTDKRIHWHFAISFEVQQTLEKWNINTDNMHIFKESPARNKQKRKDLYILAEKYNVDLVYTMAGPAYVNFKQKHIMGISNGYITHTDFEALSIDKTLSQIIKILMLITYQSFFARKADFFIFQTKEAQEGFVKRFLISKKKTKVISNSIDNNFTEYFINKEYKDINLEKKVQIFCPASAFPHKALSSIPQIAFELSKISQAKYKFEFILTINNNSDLYKKIQRESQKLNVVSNIKNRGPYNYTDVFSLYENSDVVFVPSILETFSANYLEAFASKKVLVVSDRGFARDICENAAIYTEPFHPKETALILNKIILNSDKQKELARNAINIVDKYGTQEERYENLINYIQLTIKDTK